MGRNVTVNLSGISFFLPSMVQDSPLDGPRYFGRYPGPFKTILPRLGPFLGSLRPYGLLDLSARGAWLRSWHTLLSHEVKIFCEEYWKHHLTGLVDGSNVKWGVSSAAPPVQNLSHRISKYNRMLPDIKPVDLLSLLHLLPNGQHEGVLHQQCQSCHIVVLNSWWLLFCCAWWQWCHINI